MRGLGLRAKHGGHGEHRRPRIFYFQSIFRAHRFTAISIYRLSTGRFGSFSDSDGASPAIWSSIAADSSATASPSVA